MGSVNPSNDVEILLCGEDVPFTLRVVRLLLSGAVLELEGPLLSEGQLAIADMSLGMTAEPMRIGLRVAWNKADVRPGVPGCYLAALEFVGTWQRLVEVRAAVAAFQGSRVLVDDAEVGYVVSEEDGLNTCYDVNTSLVAVFGYSEGRYVVRQRGGVQGLSSVAEALACAYGLPAAPKLDPPLEVQLTPAPCAVPAQEEDDEEALLGMQTIVIKDAPLSESEIMGAQTLVIRAPTPAEEEKILAAQTMLVGRESRASAAPAAPAAPVAPRQKRSKVYSGPLLVGIVQPRDGSWSVQDDDEDEVARVVVRDQRLEIVSLGGGEAHPVETWGQALMLILDLDEEPTVVPPLAEV